ncbi:MAG: glycosyltransferase family 2 protein [Microbacteriaceae bacterium]|jgi:glycosyltransferase involved in cell wall biosynthesis|nr:glycosyltransferase family 2 protein [Microbacteriaceae bacterium]HEV7956684.1 glycosyltransferase [Marisediminicola sp.]
MSLTVSVALCTYNGAQFVEQQIASILGQRQRPTEIVVSDDASDDETLPRVRKALQSAERSGIAVHMLGDGYRRGVTANFARAIAACSSDIVMLSDQDDVWHGERVSVAVEAFELNPGMLFRHENARLVDAAGEPLGITLFEALAITDADRERINLGAAFPVYLRRNLATGATVSFRRELFDLAAPLPDEWVHDEWLAIVAAALGSVQIARDANVDYRQHGSNVIGVAAPTLRYRLGRMLATTRHRNDALAARSRTLAERLRSIPGVPSEFTAAAATKAQFESERAALPPSRLRRAPGIWMANRGARYARFASQGRLDMLRDLLLRS